MRQIRVVPAQLILRHNREQPGAQVSVVDVGIQQHLPHAAVARHDPVDGVTLRLQLLVQAVLDHFATAVEQLRVHVHRLVECVAPSLMKEAHESQAPPRRYHLAQTVGGSHAHAVVQHALVVAVDPADVGRQHVRRLDEFQPCEKSAHAGDRRARRAFLDAVQGREPSIVSSIQ